MGEQIRQYKNFHFALKRKGKGKGLVQKLLGRLFMRIAKALKVKQNKERNSPNEFTSKGHEHA